ncbi:basic proline-rich protein-like [Haemorhous mexicanus]|uniref:basic proline-rich protein-like n=1 Tax=Haemorhous mexicanus TaxID=30427 RepID=UPI0028BF1DD8|nr:basic proline-rich protein-like [Haemorhous mexicanus]
MCPLQPFPYLQINSRVTAVFLLVTFLGSRADPCSAARPGPVSRRRSPGEAGPARGSLRAASLRPDFTARSPLWGPHPGSPYPNRAAGAGRTWSRSPPPASRGCSGSPEHPRHPPPPPPPPQRRTARPAPAAPCAPHSPASPSQLPLQRREPPREGAAAPPRSRISRASRSRLPAAPGIGL